MSNCILVGLPGQRPKMQRGGFTVHVAHVAVYVDRDELVHTHTLVVDSGVPANRVDLSHLCHNKNCVNPDHLVFELNTINQARVLCAETGRCFSHGDSPYCRINELQ